MDKKNKLTEEKQYVGQKQVTADTPRKQPDELSGIHIEAKFKISDPITGKTIVEGRA